MRTIRVMAEDISKQDDWRPSLYLFGGAALRQLGKKWFCLGDVAETVVDGWRVSRNQLADSFDPAAMSAPLFRLRNVQPLILQAEPEHWQPPQIVGKPYCVQPSDILIKKVGGAVGSLVSDAHGQHPIDANLALVRGLPAREAVWACFCLNQPLYQAYLNESEAISSLLRLGLKKLKSTPICPMPGDFNSLAESFLGAYGRLADAQRMLASMRKEVAEWLESKFGDFDLGYWQNTRQCHWQFFNPAHIDDSLLISQVEQNYLRSELMQQFHLQPIGNLAKVNPSSQSSAVGGPSKVLQISNISDSLNLNSPLPDREDSRWRVQNRSLKQYDVVVSTFADNTRVAYLHRQPDHTICPSEQIAVLNFFQYPAAYALLMDSWLVKMQLQRLASGGGLRFIQRQHVMKLVMPVLDAEIGSYWQQKIDEHHEKSQHAQALLKDVLNKMTDVYNQAHKPTQKSRLAA